jgi:hypothetical protein
MTASTSVRQRQSAWSVSGLRPGQDAGEVADGAGRQECVSPGVRTDAAVPNLEVVLVYDVLDASDRPVKVSRRLRIGQAAAAEHLGERLEGLCALPIRERAVAGWATLHRPNPTPRACPGSTGGPSGIRGQS